MDTKSAFRSNDGYSYWLHEGPPPGDGWALVRQGGVLPDDVDKTFPGLEWSDDGGEPRYQWKDNGTVFELYRRTSDANRTKFAGKRPAGPAAPTDGSQSSEGQAPSS